MNGQARFGVARGDRTGAKAALWLRCVWVDIRGEGVNRAMLMLYSFASFLRKVLMDAVSPLTPSLVQEGGFISL